MESIPTSNNRANTHSELSGEDISLIQNLLNRVMLAMDSGDGEAFAACYTTDGICDIAINGAHKAGSTELASLGVSLHQQFPTCRHWEGNVCVSPGPTFGTATNQSYWKALDGGDVVSTGLHIDNLVKDDSGVWRIKAREIRHTWTKVKGHILATP